MKSIESECLAANHASAPHPATPRHRQRPIAAGYCVGIVTAVEGDQFTLISGTLTAKGRRAVSCLLEPAIGDTVATLIVAPDSFWITAVLQREEGTAHTLRLRGPTSIDTGDAALDIASGSLGIKTTAFALSTQRAQVHSDDAVLTGQDFRVIGSTIKIVGALLSTVFDRVMHYSKQHWRKTEGMDRVSGACVEVEAQQILRHKGEHVFINGEKLVKTTDSQVHFG